MKLVLMFVLMVSAMQAKPLQPPAWQTGRLVEASRTPRYSNLYGVRQWVEDQHIVIDAGNTRFTCENGMLRHPNVVPGEPIQFGVQGRMLWIRDAEGRVFALKLTRREVH